MKMKGWFVILALVVSSGCAWHNKSSHSASSVVDYLYSDQQEKVIQASVPHLNLPLNVGIAFVPEANRSNFSEAQKMVLMKNVASRFQSLRYVDNVELIPSAYLRPRGGFANLDQLKSMFGIDVVVLVSHDQMQFTDEGRSAIAYWTLVGAYFVKGEKNDTHTLLDAAVYDINSRKLLFRAPGTSHVKSRATLAEASEQNRKDNVRGIEEASEILIQNLAAELAVFEQKVKDSPREYQVTRHSGYSGGGSGGMMILLMLMACGVARKLR